MAYATCVLSAAKVLLLLRDPRRRIGQASRMSTAHVPWSMFLERAAHKNSTKRGLSMVEETEPCRRRLLAGKFIRRSCLCDFRLLNKPVASSSGGGHRMFNKELDSV